MALGWYFCFLCKKYKSIRKGNILSCKHDVIEHTCVSKLTPALSYQDFEYYRVKGWITGAEEGWKKKEHEIPCHCGRVHILDFTFRLE